MTDIVVIKILHDYFYDILIWKIVLETGHATGINILLIILSNINYLWGLNDERVIRNGNLKLLPIIIVEYFVEKRST